jgi:hypothetical protein
MRQVQRRQFQIASAKWLGLTIPQAALLQGTEVIE